MYQRPEKFYISLQAKLILTPIAEVTAATTAEKYEIRQRNATVQNVGPWYWAILRGSNNDTLVVSSPDIKNHWSYTAGASDMLASPPPQA